MMIGQHFELGLSSKVFLLLTLCIVLSQGACANWGTSYSGKYDEENLIRIHLNHYGGLGLGHGGIGRILLEGYMFELKPIKQAYLDGEIRMKDRFADPGKIESVRGKISFNDDYSVVTISIQREKDGVFYDFPGNGTYKLNEGH
jgi:hypothetical protein